MSIADFPLTEKQVEQAEFMLDYPPFDPSEEEGDPASWPWWTDAFCWELGPDRDEHAAISALEPIPDEPTFEPDPADRAWLAPQSIADMLAGRLQTRESLLEDERFEAWLEMQAGAHRSLSTVE